MKLNDPFGRMERKHEAEYEAMRTSLRKSGINNPIKARELIRESKERIYKTVGIVLVIFLLFVAAFPKTLPVALCITVLILVMCFKSLVSGKRYIERYIEEELSGNKDGNSPTR